MGFHNLIEPLYVNVAINLNNDYNPQFKDDPFKYRVAILVSKVILSVTPDCVKDVFQLKAFLEMNSYIKELRRYRPTIRLQTMIDACKKNPSLAGKKSQVCRDWFRLVLWYVRLRKASQGKYCHELLRVQQQASNVDMAAKVQAFTS